jgi:Family of unknown function (DUF5715)
MRNQGCYFFPWPGSNILEKLSILRGPHPMRSRFSLAVLVFAGALALPAFASTARPVTHARHTGHRTTALHHAALTHARAHHRTPAGQHASPSSHPAVTVPTAADPAQNALTTGYTDRHTAIDTVARVHWMPPLRGSRESLLRQNVRDTAEGLLRIQDDAQLNEMRANRQLVLVPASSSLLVNPALPYNRRYCRPWTAHFLSDLARVHYARFHRPLEVNSAVRTVAFQRSLMQINGNAAAADGDLASPHLTGAAIDIGKKGLSMQEIAWMRAWLLPLQTAGKIDVEEEFYQSCFHITVYESYVPPSILKPAPRRRASTTLLAARIR